MGPTRALTEDPCPFNLPDTFDRSSHGIYVGLKGLMYTVRFGNEGVYTHMCIYIYTVYIHIYICIYDCGVY